MTDKHPLINTKVISNNLIGENVYHIIIKPEAPINFTPGQFIMFSAKIKGEQVDRSYSIANSPGKYHLEFVIRVEPNGKMSQYITHLKPGDTLNIKGPFGRFGQCQIESPSKLIFIAAGAGITPIRSMIQHLSSQTEHPPLTLFFGFRTPADYLFREELEALQQSGHLNLIPCISRETELPWEGYRGHIQVAIEKELRYSPEQAVFICGLPTMVDETKKMLFKMGFSRKQVHLEAW